MSKDSFTVSFLVYGKNALFTDPFTKSGGEKNTMLIPSYDAMRGIAESVYWKPSIRVIVEKVRVLNRITTQAKGTLTKHLNGSKGLSNYTYLQDVAYQVQIRIEVNEERMDLQEDFILPKHFAIFKQAIKKGGRKDVFLGTRDCYAYVEPCEFGEGTGYYDRSGTINYGLAVHSINYPNSKNPNFSTNLWDSNMVDGVIHFPKPSECTITRTLTTQEYSFNQKPIKPVLEEGDAMK